MMTSTLPFKENVLLKDFCTLGIGGPARFFFEARSIDDMQQALAFCREHAIPYFILGKGSNCLFDDRGFNGAVILNKIDFFDQPADNLFHVGAGYSFALLGVQTARKGWSGLEFASGIPASVGGAVFMNAGANGKETADCLHSVDFIADDGKYEILGREKLQYAYRHSPFQKRRGAIVGATFMLKKHAEARQKQIEIVTIRKNSQPYNSKSAGCVFLNPECGHAGALIDRCGLKGKNIGGAKVSEKHANFLINEEGATCKEMLNLMAFVREKVKEASNIELKSEVRYIPYE